MNTTRMILNALRRRHEEPRNGNSRAWVYAEEVRVATGFGSPAGRTPGQPVRYPGDQRIDAFALHTWPSQKYNRVAYEVKAFRADLQRELKQPWKCEPALGLSNQFYLVIPTGMLEGVTLPDEWGVIEWTGDRLFVERAAPWRESEVPPYSFMLSLARNLQAETERSRS